MTVSPYLHFAGSCREAFTTYRDILGGELTLIAHRDMPVGAGAPDDWQDKIMHAHLGLDGGSIQGSDRQDEAEGPVQRMEIALYLPTAEEAERIFPLLAEGGEVRMPLAETPWSPRFGMLTDRFGMPWLLNVG